MIQIGAIRRMTSLLLAIFLFSLLSTFVSALPPTVPPLHTPAFSRYDYGIHREKLIRRQNTTIAITGALGGILLDGTPPVRKEIRELQQDAAAWTLYLLGLDSMQFTDQHDPLSWYQIAGIHGRPYAAWDNAEATPGNEDVGYCQHVSILFPTWHRPYVALFEQVLYNHVQNIAAMYPPQVRRKYVNAAVTFRAPYWDWALTPASGESVLPESLQVLNVLVDGPVGKQMIGNPLYSYDFHPLDPNDIPSFPMNEYTSTMRYPTSNSANATSRNSEVVNALNPNLPSIQQRLYNLLSTFTNYTTFSNEAWLYAINPSNPDDYSTYDSIESLHDLIHGATGGDGGHMTYIEYSAFDPLFMLHHAMVDRVLGLWQSLNPKAWLEPQPAMFGTYATAAGEMQDRKTPLSPFHRDTEGRFWTSDAVRDMKTLGYGYAETMRAEGQTDQEYREQVISWVNYLYGSSSQPRSSSSSSARPSPSPTAASNPSAALRRRSDNATYREYIAVLRVPKHALSAPFTIHFFLGPAPAPGCWFTSPNLVGSHSVASMSRPGTASPGTSDIVTATVPLTAKLREKGLGEAALDAVKAYLAQNLRFRVVMADGTQVGNEEMVERGLCVGVASAEVRQRGCEKEFPVWGEMQGLGDVDARL